MSYTFLIYLYRGIFNLLVVYQLAHQDDSTYQGKSLIVSAVRHTHVADTTNTCTAISISITFVRMVGMIGLYKLYSDVM